MKKVLPSTKASKKVCASVLPVVIVALVVVVVPNPVSSFSLPQQSIPVEVRKHGLSASHPILSAKNLRASPARCQKCWILSTTAQENSQDQFQGSFNNTHSTLSSSAVKDDIKTGTLQAIDISDKIDNGKKASLPSLRELLVFAFTTTMVWLSEPLLSLVDTTVVGWTCSPQSAVVQIASLGPATMLYDSCIYLSYFLAIATTNQLAPALARKNWKELRQKTSYLLGLSTAFGLAISAIIFGGGKRLITEMAGTALNGQIISLATTYACIRAVVAPFAVVGAVAQSFCLTNLDTTTPAKAVLAASIVNIIGDLALAPKWGIQGAAVATGFATVASTGILLNKVRSTTKQWRKNQMAEEENEKQESNVKLMDAKMPFNSTASITTSSTSSPLKLFKSKKSSSLLLNWKKPKSHNHQPDSTAIPFMSLPDRKSTWDLVKLAGPIFFTIFGKVACYAALTLRTTGLGVLPLAAYNIMMRVFCFFVCFGDSLSQAAQSYYPSVSKELRTKLLKRLLLVSGFIGLWDYQALTLVLTRFGTLLTKDSSIIHLMSSFTTFLGASLLIYPFVTLFEGIALASNDMTFLVITHALSLAMHFGIVFSPLTTTFGAVWQALFIYQIVQIVPFGIRQSKEQYKNKNHK